MRSGGWLGQPTDSTETGHRRTHKEVYKRDSTGIIRPCGVCNAGVGDWCHPVYVAQSFREIHAPATASSREVTDVTRRDLFDLLRDEAGPWWGRLDEISFLEHFYDLDSLPSTDSRHATAREDIGWHRVGNYDWDDDWVFADSRFRLADGPDQVLLDFLAYMAHPVVQPDAEKAVGLVTRLNGRLSPDGWELRASGFISGRPVYAAVKIPGGPGRMIRLAINNGDPGKLDLVLGQASQILGDAGHTLAQGLITAATLTLRADGGYYHPTPGDNWTEASSEAVLVVDSRMTAEFTDELRDRVWQALRTVLVHHGRDDVVSLVIEPSAPPLPALTADWRASAARSWIDQEATRRGASAPRETIPAKTASYSPAAQSLPSTRSSRTSSGSRPSRTRSRYCRYPAPGSATLASVPRTSS